MEERKYTLGKSERLCSKKLIERLFAGGNKSFPAFPMRVVYMPLGAEEEGAEVSILISVLFVFPASFGSPQKTLQACCQA